MFRVKICGLTTPEDARLVAGAGADAVGLNFVAGSPRCIDPALARLVVDALPRRVLRVGVFAGMDAASMLSVAAAVGLDCIQLHGLLTDEAGAAPGRPLDPPERCRELAPLPVIRAVRLRGDGPAAAALAPARAWIEAAVAAGRGPAMLLVDAGAPSGAPAGALGGTGRVVDWERFMAADRVDVPLALAGGLTADNVAAAIRATGARAVDTASGVESAPGRKDAGLVRAFVERAIAALGPV